VDVEIERVKWVRRMRRMLTEERRRRDEMERENKQA